MDWKKTIRKNREALAVVIAELQGFAESSKRPNCRFPASLVVGNARIFRTNGIQHWASIGFRFE